MFTSTQGAIGFMAFQTAKLAGGHLGQSLIICGPWQNTQGESGHRSLGWCPINPHPVQAFGSGCTYSCRWIEIQACELTITKADLKRNDELSGWKKLAGEDGESGNEDSTRDRGGIGKIFFVAFAINIIRDNSKPLFKFPYPTSI